MRGQPFVFSQFDGGINLEASPYSLAEGQARNALNMTTGAPGATKKRNGFSSFASPPVTLTSLFPLHAATRYLVAAGSTFLYSITTGGTVTQIKSGLTSNLRWQFVQAPVQTAQGPLYGMNGTDAPIFWDASAAGAATGAWTANTGTLQNGRYLLYHDNRVFVAGVAAFPNNIYWSDITKPRDWASPNGGSTQFDPEDGQAITGIGKVGPYMIVFKERKTYLVTDSSTGAYRRIANDIGCISHRSITETSNGTFFLSRDLGVVVTDGQTFQSLSNNTVKSLLKNASTSAIQNACAVFFNNKYFLSFTQSSVNDIILEYDLSTQSWWIHRIYYTSSVTGGVNEWAILNPSTTSTLYAAGADATTFKVFEAFKDSVYQDNGNSYLANWIQPWETFGQPHLRKRLRQIRVDAYGALSVYSQRSFSSNVVTEEEKIWEASDIGTTYGGTGLFGGTGIFGDTPVITERRFYTPGTARVWSLKFESQSPQDMQINACTMAVDFRRD